MPMHVDFETFSRCNLRAKGLWAYARHPSTCILCMGYAFEQEPPQIWIPGQPVSQRLRDGLAGIVRAFNATFERAIFTYCAHKVGLPIPHDSDYEDTQALARMCGFPGSLADCARVLKLPQRKDEDGHRLIQLFSVPQADGRRVMPADAPHDWQLMLDYCKQDVVVDRAVHEALPIQKLTPFERTVWAVDSTVNQRGIHIDQELCTAGKEMAALARAAACERLPDMTRTAEMPLGAVWKIGQNKRILAYCAYHGYPIANLTKPLVKEKLEDPNMPEPVRNLLELRADVNMTSLGKFSSALDHVEDDGRVRGAFAYHGANTGRWTARVVQFQNMPRPKLKIDELELDLIRTRDFASLGKLYENPLIALRDSIRSMVIAKPGHTLCVLDYSSVEARGIGWLANDPAYQEAYRNDHPLYEKFASLIYGYEVNKDDHPEQRFVGKESVLGLGYGMGWDKFQVSCANKGTKIPDELSQRCVQLYRSTFRKVPALWRLMGQLALRVVRTGESGALETGTTKISMHMHKGCLAIKLPSGRALWYPHPQIVVHTNKKGYTSECIQYRFWDKKQWFRAILYGAKIVQHITQGFCRDLTAASLVACEESALCPIMHAHDEIVSEVPEFRGDVALRKMQRIFAEIPSWGTGLILGSSGFVSPYYKKG